MRSPAPFHERPCAAAGLNSYRYDIDASTGRFVMIGARDDADALNEAGRSLPSRTLARANLKKWDGVRYVSVV